MSHASDDTASGGTGPVPPGPGGTAAAASALRVEGLGLQIGGATILDDVNLDVPDGEIVGIIGPNGAGKTTLFNIVSGLLTPTRGSVHMHGRDITSLSVPARARAGLGRTFQTSSYFPGLTVLENVRLAAQVQEGGSYSLLRFPRSTDQATARARATLETVGLAHHAHAKAGDISHGDKRKLEIAVLLVADAGLVLLDEPMAGVASGDVDGLVENIRDMQRLKNCTVLMVEHHIDVLLGFVDRVAVMYFGTIIAFDTPQRIMENPTVQSAYLGRSA